MCQKEICSCPIFLISHFSRRRHKSAVFPVVVPIIYHDWKFPFHTETTYYYETSVVRLMHLILFDLICA